MTGVQTCALPIFYVPPEYLEGESTDPFESLQIYPNPTKGLIKIEFENEIYGDLLVKIFNQDGKELYNFIFEKGTAYFSTELNLKGQTEGYYLIALDLNKRIVTRKVIIE